MSNVNDVCDALATALRSTVSDLAVKAYMDDKISSPPEAHIYTLDFDPRMVFGDAKQPLRVGVRLLLHRGSSLRTAQTNARRFMGRSDPWSIVDALEGYDYDTSLIDFVEVTRIGQPSEFEHTDNVAYLAVDFEVDVVATT